MKVADHTTRKAVMKLLLASLIAIIFMIGEVIGKEGGGIYGFYHECVEILLGGGALQ